jgi:hypothetical protein
MRRKLVVAGLAAMLAAACSSTVAGRPTFAGGPAPTSPGSATGSATSPAPTGPAGGTAGPGRQSLSCSGKVISPTGAPYCYLVPSGFTDVSGSATVATSLGNEKYRTAVAIAARDLAIVTVYELNRSVDGVSDEQLESEMSGVLGQLTSQGITLDSTTARRTTVDGARSFGYHARIGKDNLEEDLSFIFRGKTEVEVNCQWQQRKNDVVRACGELLGSLQIKTVT